VPVVNRSALVPYSAGEMFSLVDDIDAYPQFLPWCSDARVWEREQDELRATIELKKGAIHKSFTTRNRMQADKMIEMRLVEGPFRQLEGFWRFEVLDEHACKVSLDLAYEFSSTMLRLAIGPLFNQIANSLVDAFCARAVEVYGRR